MNQSRNGCALVPEIFILIVVTVSVCTGKFVHLNMGNANALPLTAAVL